MPHISIFKLGTAITEGGCEMRFSFVVSFNKCQLTRKKPTWRQNLFSSSIFELIFESFFLRSFVRSLMCGCLVDSSLSLSFSHCLASLPLNVCWFLRCESMQSSNAIVFLSFKRSDELTRRNDETNSARFRRKPNNCFKDQQAIPDRQKSKENLLKT